jgi:hypothetical protein
MRESFNKTKMKYVEVISVHNKGNVLMETQARGDITPVYVFRQKFIASPYLGLASCLKDTITT